ncbi:MAG: hypothetical protein ACK4GG_14165 [Sphingomonas sp.]|mgnify:CR=1 FL=1
MARDIMLRFTKSGLVRWLSDPRRVSWARFLVIWAVAVLIMRAGDIWLTTHEKSLVGLIGSLILICIGVFQTVKRIRNSDWDQQSYGSPLEGMTFVLSGFALAFVSFF